MTEFASVRDHLEISQTKSESANSHLFRTLIASHTANAKRPRSIRVVDSTFLSAPRNDVNIRRHHIPSGCDLTRRIEPRTNATTFHPLIIPSR
jgi:hypothetical protein